MVSREVDRSFQQPEVALSYTHSPLVLDFTVLRRTNRALPVDSQTGITRYRLYRQSDIREDSGGKGRATSNSQAS